MSYRILYSSTFEYGNLTKVLHLLKIVLFHYKLQSTFNHIIAVLLHLNFWPPTYLSKFNYKSVISIITKLVISCTKSLIFLVDGKRGKDFTQALLLLRYWNFFLEYLNKFFFSLVIECIATRSIFIRVFALKILYKPIIFTTILITFQLLIQVCLIIL